MTKDWVVIYRDDKGGDGRWTVVTSRFGPLKGRRIVRSREQKCGEFYASENERAGIGASDPARTD